MRQKYTHYSQGPANKLKKLRISVATLLAKALQDTSKGRATAEAGRIEAMGLYAPGGGRKYLNAAERRRYAAAAETMPPSVREFCLLIMWSGCRISEALAVTAAAVDYEAGTVSLLTLKRRRARVVRQVPLPPSFMSDLSAAFGLPERARDPLLASLRLWNWSRSTGWRYVKEVMRRARISGAAAMPKGLRHAFGAAAFQAVPPHLVQRWLGHASLRTTAIYGEVSGDEERLLAERLWRAW